MKIKIKNCRFSEPPQKHDSQWTPHFAPCLGRMSRILEQDFLEEAPMSWEGLVKKTFRKKEEILPMQMAEVRFCQ